MHLIKRKALQKHEVIYFILLIFSPQFFNSLSDVPSQHLGYNNQVNYFI